VRSLKEALTMRGHNGIAACFLLTVALIAAESPFIGTWKLNTAKSKFAPGTATKEMTVMFEPDGNT
jgi:hypothetical protein